MKTYLMRHKTSNKLYAIRANSPEEALQKVSGMLRASGIDASLADVSQFTAPSDLAGIMGGDGKPMTLEQIRASGNELEDLGDGSGGVITAGTKPKPTTPATSGFEWTLGSDGEWLQTPISGGGIEHKEGDVTNPGWTWRMIDGKLVETKDPSGFNAGEVPGGLENLDPEAAYLNALSEQGQNPEGRFGSYLRGLQGPTSALFNWNSISGKLPTEDYADRENAFSRFAGRTPFSQIRGAATNAFRDITNSGAAVNADTASFMKQYRDPYATAEGADYEASTTARDDILDLGRQAAASKYTPFTANRFLSSDDLINERYARQGYRGDFVDFAKKYLGLATGF